MNKYWSARWIVTSHATGNEPGMSTQCRICGALTHQTMLRIPFEQAAQIVGENCTAGAIQQAILKLRGKMMQLELELQTEGVP